MIQPRRTAPSPTKDSTTHPQIRVCNNWISDSCVYGNKCRFLHSWVHSVDGNNTSNSLATLMKLNGHKKAVTSVGPPSGSNRLYSGSRDGRVSVWDRDSGRCVNVITNGAEISCLISAKVRGFFSVCLTPLNPGELTRLAVITSRSFSKDQLGKLML